MRLTRGGSALTLLAALSVWFLAPTARASAAALAGTDFPGALLGLGSLLQLALGCWVLTVVATARVAGRSTVLRALTPRLLRRALFAGTAGALGLLPACAEPAPDVGNDLSEIGTASHALTGLALPDRPTSSRQQPGSDDVDSVVHVVRVGDTLWAIAASHLPGHPTHATIARSAARWHSANRDTIGPDADLILPAQHLTQPAKDHT